MLSEGCPSVSGALFDQSHLCGALARRVRLGLGAHAIAAASARSRSCNGRGARVRASAGVGCRVASSKTPRPVFNSLKSLVTHVVFGVGLYLSALVIAGIFRHFGVN